MHLPLLFIGHGVETKLSDNRAKSIKDGADVEKNPKSMASIYGSCTPPPHTKESFHTDNRSTLFLDGTGVCQSLSHALHDLITDRHRVTKVC